MVYGWIDHTENKIKIEKIIKEHNIPFNLIISKLIWKFKYHRDTNIINNQQYQSNIFV